MTRRGPPCSMLDRTTNLSLGIARIVAVLVHFYTHVHKAAERVKHGQRIGPQGGQDVGAKPSVSPRPCAKCAARVDSIRSGPCGSSGRLRQGGPSGRAIAFGKKLI